MMGTRDEFEFALKKIDPMVIVDFDSLPMGVRVTPYNHNPRTRAMLIEAVKTVRPLGILVQFPSDKWEVVDVDPFLPKPSLWAYLKEWWKQR